MKQSSSSSFTFMHKCIEIFLLTNVSKSFKSSKDKSSNLWFKVKTIKGAFTIKDCLTSKLH
jgi:hypothetical protein